MSNPKIALDTRPLTKIYWIYEWEDISYIQENLAERARLLHTRRRSFALHDGGFYKNCEGSRLRDQ